MASEAPAILVAMALPAEAAGVFESAGVEVLFTSVGKVNAAINEGLRSPEMKHSLAQFNVEPNIASPQEFKSFLAAEARKWGDIIKATNIKIE